MRTDYTCIGACIDVGGLSLVRFDLNDTHFRVLKSYTIAGMPTYDETLKRILELAETKTDRDIKTIDLLCNFSSSLKNTILNKNDSAHTIRVKTTVIRDQMEDMVLNLYNLLSPERIIVELDERTVINALKIMMEIEPKNLKNIYEGNETLNQVLYAVLHSISWLEGQMIKHQMV